MDNSVSKIAEQAMEEGKEKLPADEHSAPSSSMEKASATMTMSSKRVVVVALAVFVVAVTLAIGLGIRLSNRNNNNTSINSTDSQSSDAATTTTVVEKVRIADATTRSLALISGPSLQKTYLDCADARVDMRKVALLLANQTIQANLDSYYFLEGPSTPVSSPTSQSVMAGKTAADGQSDSVATTEDSYGTNNQVEGVEEPDSVQSDGKSIFAAYGSEIIKVSVDSQTIVARTKIPKGEDNCDSPNIRSLLLIDSRLVVFSSVNCYADRRKTSKFIGGPYRFGTKVFKFIVYDTANLSPVGDVTTLPGDYIDARAIGDHVYVVTSRYIDVYSYTNRFDPYGLTSEQMYNESKRFNKTDYEVLAWAAAEKYADDFVADLIENFDCSTLQQITLFQNQDVFLPYGPVMESIAVVTGFNIKTPSSLSTASRVMPTAYWNMYASADTLILAAEGYWIGDDVQSETYILAYQLAEATATPIGVGKVPGTLLNQFAMDEHNGYLRFATSIQERWRFVENGNKWESFSIADSDNMIVVLEVPTSGTDLKEVGRLAGLGKEGETIFSVRFLGDRAFVVTFKVIDPFYTISLKDPTKPAKVGELEIPGYSNYLHPIGDNLILGVGQAVVNEQAAGLQISLFDVSNFAKPVRVANYIEQGGDGSTSDAQYDHKAFRLLENGLLILPVQVQNWNWDPQTSDTKNVDDETFDGFKVYHVNKDAKTITDYYEISHGSDYYNGCWGFSYMSPRSLVIDGDVWTLKTHTILVHDLTDRVQAGDDEINLDENLGADECTPFYFGDGAKPGFVI